MDEPHGPAQLGHHFFVRLRRHKRVRPSVNGDVVQIIDRGLELQRVQENVLTNKKVGRALVVLDEEVVEGIRRLKKSVNSWRQLMQRTRN
jgi:hypothetical protein